MAQRDITEVLVDIIKYEHLWPTEDSEDAVFGFTHSLEVNSICADMLSPHVVWTLRIFGISAAWYNKPFLTFLGVIALARHHLWLTSEGFSRSLVESDTLKVPVAPYHRLIHS